MRYDVPNVNEKIHVFQRENLTYFDLSDGGNTFDADDVFWWAIELGLHGNPSRIGSDWTTESRWMTT